LEPIASNIERFYDENVMPATQTSSRKAG